MAPSELRFVSVDALDEGWDIIRLPSEFRRQARSDELSQIARVAMSGRRWRPVSRCCPDLWSLNLCLNAKSTWGLGEGR